MPYYEFTKNDVIYNVVETNPEVEFFIYNNQVYLNNEREQYNAFSGNVDLKHSDHGTGHLSLYEMNVSRPAGHLIYPFVTKDGSLGAFKTVSTESFNQDFVYGDILTGSYPLTASISKDYYVANHVSTSFGHDGDAGQANRILALMNTFDAYTSTSPHYAYTSSVKNQDWDKGVQEIGLVSIPSIFYGSSIERGSVELKFYMTGTLIGTLRDDAKNGELIQVGPTGSNGSGSIAGVVLYNEGFLALTGSWDISDGENTDAYIAAGQQNTPRWIDFAVGANDGTAHAISASSFQMKLRGTNRIPMMTMFAHAPKGELNHSNNPTYVQHGQSRYTLTGSQAYRENKNLSIKNIVSGNFNDHTASFQKETYISKIGIYDDDKNLIAVAKLATPVKKTEERDYTFKMKYDF